MNSIYSLDFIVVPPANLKYDSSVEVLRLPTRFKKSVLIKLTSESLSIRHLHCWLVEEIQLQRHGVEWVLSTLFILPLYLGLLYSFVRLSLFRCALECFWRTIINWFSICFDLVVIWIRVVTPWLANHVATWSFNPFKNASFPYASFLS